MDIESVRELKQSILEAAINPSSVHAEKAVLRVMAAGPGTTVDRVPRSLALGITHGQEKNYRLAVRVQSRALAGGPELARIRKAAHGEVDVRFVGRISKQGSEPLQLWHRPLVPGCSIGHFRVATGTLGCFVTTKSGERRILSNNHILADENLGKVGDAILQQGRLDGGRRPKNVVGALDRFIRLRKTSANLVDAAIATVKASIQIEAAKLAGLGQILGVSDAPLTRGMRVFKVGRTSATTSGRVTAFELDNVVVGYDLGNLTFDNQIEIEGEGNGPFGMGGDSGSLIVDENLAALALLFAGSDVGGRNGKGLTYGNPISEVFARLGVKLLN